MKYTIIPDDKFISVDGVGVLNIDPFPEIDPGIHAVQWYESFGEIEFKGDGVNRPPNERFDDPTRFQAFLDLHAEALSAEAG